MYAYHLLGLQADVAIHGAEVVDPEAEQPPRSPPANDLWSEADDGARSPSPPPASSAPREILRGESQPPLAMPPSSTTSEVGDGTEVRAARTPDSGHTPH